MVRILLCLLLLFSSTPAFAGTLEDALARSSYVMVYLTSPDCAYCKKFDPVFQKLATNYKTVTFVKVDARTPYGRNLASQLGAAYVPYVLLMQSKQKMMTQVVPECLIEYACVSKELNSFIK